MTVKRKSKNTKKIIYMLSALCIITLCASGAKATTKEQASLKLTNLQGIEVASIPRNAKGDLYIHIYLNDSGDELRCGLDVTIQRIDVISKGEAVSSGHPFCHTNLLGVLSIGIPSANPGIYEIRVVESNSSLEFLPAQLVVD